MKNYNYILLLVGVFVALLVGFLVGHSYCKTEPIEVIKEKVDTLYVRDTITVSKPKFIERTKLDSVLVPVTDTLRLRDTLFVYMDRERVVWEDSLSVVYASGIRPQIDSVKHYVQERIITKEIQVRQIKKTHWGVGVSAGYGVGKAGLTPYVGVGVNYNIISW